MTKIDIFSGFLGAGKTTLIKKLIREAFAGEKLVLIENEFGEIGVDGAFLQDAGVEITEMNSGCICCSLVGDFTKALQQVLTDFTPDRILIEPSGVGKLSDVIRAVRDMQSESVLLNSFTTVVDAKKCKMYMKNFGEFFNDQVQYARTVIFSHTEGMTEDAVNTAVSLVRGVNENCTLVTTPWDQLSGKKILQAMEHTDTLSHALEELLGETKCPVCGELHHEHHHHDEHCHCGEEHLHHHHDEHCHCEHEHHHHHHDEHCHCEHEHHHHHHDEHCDCGHEHHHADEVFVSWGKETARRYDEIELKQMIDDLNDANVYGTVLRAKGIVGGKTGEWLHFDYVPGETEIRVGGADVIGRLCVIGTALKERALEELFKI